MYIEHNTGPLKKIGQQQEDGPPEEEVVDKIYDLIEERGLGGICEDLVVGGKKGESSKTVTGEAINTQINVNGRGSEDEVLGGVTQPSLAEEVEAILSSVQTVNVK